MKPRVLITGFNAAQCTRDYFLNQEVQVVPSHYSLIRCLEDLGYEVEQRRCLLGEDLSVFDEVIVYIHSIQAFSHNLWSGLYAISARPDCIIAFDDWQVDQIYDSFEQFKRDLVKPDETAFRQYLFDLWKGPETRDQVMTFRSNFVATCDVLAEKKNRMLVSAFDKGDLSKLELGWNGQVFRFNPNPYHLNRKKENGYGTGSGSVMDFFGGTEGKERSWNFSSLVQNKTRKWLDKLNPSGWTWPIHYYGGRRGEFKSARVVESEMCRIYSTQWGCLMPGYFHTSGDVASGWWRARPLQVADAGSILVGEPAELFVYYQDRALSDLKPVEIEQMSEAELATLAALQKQAIYDNHPLDKAVTRREISAILEAK